MVSRSCWRPFWCLKLRSEAWKLFTVGVSMLESSCSWQFPGVSWSNKSLNRSVLYTKATPRAFETSGALRPRSSGLWGGLLRAMQGKAGFWEIRCCDLYGLLFGNDFGNENVFFLKMLAVLSKS